MTKREFMEAVIAETQNEELVAHAKKEIEKLDRANAEKSKKRAEKAKENEPIKKAIVDFITENGGKHLAADIGEAIGESTAKVSSMSGQLVDDGVLKVEDVKVKGKGKRKAYSLA